MGAVFAYDPDWLPFPFSPPPRHREEGPVGLLDAGRLAFGPTVEACLDRFPFSAAERAEVEAFRAGRAEARQLSARPYMALNAHFKVIYPSDMACYAPVRQRDALHRSVTDHYEQGNGTLIDALVERIETPVETGAEVTCVEAQGDRVRVTYARTGRERQVVARTAVVATPATVALKLIRPISPPCFSFLNSVGYGRYTVVALGLDCDAGLLEPFAYVVTPGLPCDTIVRQGTRDARRVVLLVYYGESASAGLHRQSDVAVVKQALAHVRCLPLEGLDAASVLFSDVQRWDPGGSILNQEHTSATDPLRLSPSDLVFLAGDYAYHPFPFGMHAALNAGRTAAGMVTQALFNTLIPQQWGIPQR
jgi:hypothetical protein